MKAIWIKRDESGIVKVASVAEYTDAATLKKLREDGRKLELVSAETVTLNAPLPADVRVIE